MTQQWSEDRLVDITFILGYLTIIVLRIFNVINWEWKWILIPFWLPILLSAIGLILGIIIGIPWKLYLIYKEKNK